MSSRDVDLALQVALLSRVTTRVQAYGVVSVPFLSAVAVLLLRSCYGSCSVNQLSIALLSFSVPVLALAAVMRTGDLATSAVWSRRHPYVLCSLLLFIQVG
jgi:hypothetical protein